MPPRTHEHPKECTVLRNGTVARDAYQDTLAKGRLYTKAGYHVFCVWEHEWTWSVCCWCVV